MNLRTLTVGLLASLVALSGCDTGYRAKNGSYVFVTWDEGHGRRENVIRDIDPATFTILNQKAFAKDKNNAYSQYAKISGADPNTFVALSDSFAKDSHGVYYGSLLVTSADPATFVVIDEQWGKDKNDFYLLRFAVNACDSATFIFLKDEWQKDSKCAYKHGKKLNEADPNTIEILSSHFAKDENHVFNFMGEVIEGADPKTFKQGADKCTKCGQDRFRCYALDRSFDCASLK